MEKLVGSLEEAVEKLIKSNSDLKKSLIDAQEEKKLLKQQLESRERDVEELENKVKATKMAVTLSGAGPEDKEVRKVLNELLREIDKCIALLNG